MKTIKIITIALVAAFMVSCGTNYRMVTTLDKQGNAFREIYTKGAPELFDISSAWNVTRYDSAIKYNYFGEETEFNVKISRKVSSIDLFSQELNYEAKLKSFAAPKETLTKKSGLFYTNYVLTTVYEKLNYNAPISINKYLTEEEQKLWTQGNFSDYVMSGMEMADMLTKIEGNFMKWYLSNCFEIGLTIVKKWSGQNISDSDKNQIYEQLIMIKDQDYLSLTMESLITELDAFYKTNNFSEIYNSNKAMEREYEEAMDILNVLGNTISYELVLPGKILTTNAQIVNSNSVIWKVDGIHILLNDYTLEVEYRVTNIWAFILCGLIVITAIVSTVLYLLRRKHVIL